MPASRTDTKSALLLLRMHLQALCREPHPYLAALWWRLCGKRLRARARFAPLLAKSPLAYRFWLRGETPLGTVAADTSAPAIIGLVYVQDNVAPGHIGLEQTLDSLSAEGIAAICIGTSEVASPADAARMIDWDEAPWLLPIAAGDLLAPGSANAYRAAIVQTHANLIYADDDLRNAGGQRHSPHFKPAWNGELFRHFDYLTGACILRAGHEDLSTLARPDWAMRLVTDAAMASTGACEPLRIPRVLHHRLNRPAPRVPAVPARQDGPMPLVSVIVPTRNGLSLLRTCLEGLAQTDYPNLEVIIIDNGSDDPATQAYLLALDPTRYRLLRHPGPFNFSALNNRAAKVARGELLCLLNNDIEVIGPGWLKAMVAQALRDDVGAVGARLLYPDGRIQHAGVVLGVGGGAAHAHRLLAPDEEGYFHRHALPQFVSAVTAACLVVKRARFEAVGGLDETRFAVAFNDVDLCLRLNQRGWQSLYEPRATLIHHESVSRGFDRDAVGAARLAGELAALQASWGTNDQIDPFHHPQFDRFSERFVVRVQE